MQLRGVLKNLNALFTHSATLQMNSIDNLVLGTGSEGATEREVAKALDDVFDSLQVAPYKESALRQRRCFSGKAELRG